MIQPALQDDDFLDDVRVAREWPDTPHLWWLGQSGFLLQWEGHHLLLDSIRTSCCATSISPPAG